MPTSLFRLPWRRRLSPLCTGGAMQERMSAAASKGELSGAIGEPSWRSQLLPPSRRR